MILLWFSALTLATADSSNVKAVTQSITGKALEQHVAVLASDDFKGRKPFTEGEEKTVTYIADQFKKMGVQPGNGNSYFQQVPLVAITSLVDDSMTVTDGKEIFSLASMDEFAVASPFMDKEVVIKNSEIVFAGYGVVAPEHNWNDFKGLDVKGKTILVLVNDPGNDLNDTTFFNGKSMTYYGRWRYKFEEAARQGAEGIMVIHNEKTAGYPWDVARKNKGDTRLYLKSENNSAMNKMEGWITEAAVRKLFARRGINYDSTVKAASVKGYKGFSLGMKASVRIKNEAKVSTSQNVIGMVRGSKRPDECIIYTGHWDHLGVGTPLNGDSIYNGALDNGSGIACMLEIARAFTKVSPKPERSVIFLAVTAEEQGLLGSQYYAEHPIYPLKKTVANINMDMMTPLGRMKDITAVGYGQSELDDYLNEAAKVQGRYIIADPSEFGGYYRSDHFNFAKVGVPALDAKGRSDAEGHDIAWTRERNDRWRKENYHRPSDEYAPGKIDFGGVEQDAQLFFSIGYKLSNESIFPRWRASSEFKGIREQYMGK